MPRMLRVAAAQVGRIDRGTPKKEVVARLTKLLEEAASKDVKLVVFPETTFSESGELDFILEVSPNRRTPQALSFLGIISKI